jgi:hypothetical protein
MKHFLVIAVLTALTGTAQAQYVKPSPYATTTQEQARHQEKRAAELSEKLAADKKKRAECRAEAKAQKISLMKRRAYVRDCAKR